MIHCQANIKDSRKMIYINIINLQNQIYLLNQLKSKEDRDPEKRFEKSIEQIMCQEI